MKRFCLVVIWLSLPVLLLSQRAEPIYISESLYDYLFDEGSFWVYENDSSMVDSLVLTSVVHAFNPEVWVHGELVMPQVEYFQTYYESKTMNYETWDQYIGTVVVREGIDWANGLWIFLSSYVVGDESYGTEILQTYDTLTMGQFEFHHVTKMFIPDNSFENHSPTYYYFAKDAGLIKKEILDSDTSVVNETWTIKNFNTIKLLYVGVSTAENEETLVVYPNPTNRYIYLRLSDKDLDGTVTLFDFKGTILSTEKINASNIQIDLGHYPFGIYIVNIEKNNIRKSVRIIKR